MPIALPLRHFLPGPQASVSVQRAWLLILTTLIFAPFLDKAFHIDDPLFIWTAQHITRNPFDFYGFEINWYGNTAPISTIAKNPPLFSYYLAGWGSVFGWSEISLHLAGLIPSLLVVWGTFELARLWRAVPAFAALAAVCTPVFIMSGTSVMCDMAMVAFWVWAVYFWARGLEEQRRGFLVLASLCIIGSGLTKYFGLSLIPLLVAYALIKRVSYVSWRPWILLSIVGFVAYELWTKCLYGSGLLSDAIGYAGDARGRVIGTGGKGLLLGLAYLGGGVASFLFGMAFSLRWRWWCLAILIFLLSGLIVYSIDIFPMRLASSFSLLGQMALWITAGVGLCIFSTREAWRAPRDPVIWILWLWIVGTFIFAAFFNWTVSARNILPIAPALGLLLGRQWKGGSPRGWVPLACLVPALTLSCMVARADYLWANQVREDVRLLTAQAGTCNGSHWFLGHWGGQYYFEKVGWSPLAFTSTLRSGDLLAVPSRGTNVMVLPLDRVELLYRTLWKPSPYIAVGGTSAGYYSCGLLAGLPFAFVAPVDAYHTLYRVR